VRAGPRFTVGVPHSGQGGPVSGRARTCSRVPLPLNQLSLFRLNHWLPRAQAHPEVVEGTTQFHHEITHALFPQADPVFHDAAALDTAVHMLDP